MPLRFADRSLVLVEPIWQLVSQRGTEPWRFDGNEQHVYLLFEPEFSVFRQGEQFVDAVSRLPSDRVSIQHHSDATGTPTFISVRLLSPHQLQNAGQFKVRWSSP